MCYFVAGAVCGSLLLFAYFVHRFAAHFFHFAHFLHTFGKLVANFLQTFCILFPPKIGKSGQKSRQKVCKKFVKSVKKVWSDLAISPDCMWLAPFFDVVTDRVVFNLNALIFF